MYFLPMCLKYISHIYMEQINLISVLIKFFMEKKNYYQDCLARCQADPAVKKALNSTENLTGFVSVAISILSMGNPVADAFTAGSYLAHIGKMICDLKQRPKTKIDWVQEMLLLFCFIASIVSLCGMCLPILLVKIVTILSFTLFSAAWQPTLPSY